MSNEVDENELEKTARRAGGRGFISDVRAMFRYLKDKPTSAHAAMIIFAIAYFVSPVDAVPDVIPIVGYGDDALVVAATTPAIGSALERYRAR